MAMTYATVTGRIVVPGTTTGIPGQLHAAPLTNDGVLTFPSADTTTIGPAIADVTEYGTIQQPDGTPGIRIPVTASVVWRLTFHPTGKGNLPAHLGDYTITSSTDLADLVGFEPLAISPSLILQIEASAALGATNDTATASFVADPDSDTHAAVADLVADLAAEGYIARLGDVDQVLSAGVNYTAHRSGAGDFPENTLFAYESSYELGAHFFDVDLNNLGDGVLIPFHDGLNVENLTDGFGSVTGYTRARWKQLNANISDLHPGLGEQPPVTVPELMTRYGNKTAFLFDVANEGTIPYLLSVLDKFDLRRSALLGAHTLTALEQLKAASDEGVAAGKAPLNYFQSWVTYIHGSPPTLTNPTPQQAKDLGARMFSFPGELGAASDTLAGTLAAAAAGSPVQLRTYTINRRWMRDHFVALGVESFQTDHPGYVMKASAVSRVDSWRDGLRGYGLQTEVPVFGLSTKIKIVSGGLHLTPNSAADYVLVGEVSPIKAPPYSFEIDVSYPTALPATVDASIRVHFGAPTDTPVRASVYTPGDAQVYINKAGQARLYRATSATALTQQGAAVETGAFVVGTPKTLRVDVTATNVTLTADGEAPLTVANWGLGGGHVPPGAINSSGTAVRFAGLDTGLV